MTTEDTKAPSLDQEDIASLLNVRTLKQYCSCAQNILDGKCAFCELDPELNKVLQTAGQWRVWENPFPQKHTKKHYIIAPTAHFTHLHDLSSDEWDHATALIDWVVNAESGPGLEGGAVIMRFGHPSLNAGSMRHLHFNIMMPDGTGEVRIPLAKKPEDVEEKKKVVVVFERMRLGTAFEDLSEEERELVKDRLK